MCIKIPLLGQGNQDHPSAVVKDCKVRHMVPQANPLKNGQLIKINQTKCKVCKLTMISFISNYIHFAFPCNRPYYLS